MLNHQLEGPRDDLFVINDYFESRYMKVGLYLNKILCLQIRSK